MSAPRSRSWAVLPAVAALVAACGTGEVDPGAATPTPTATPTASATPTATATATPTGPVRSVVLVSTAGGLVHAGRAALFRVKSAAGGVACDWVRVDDGDPFVFTLSSAGELEQGVTYETIELVLGADGNQSFDAGADHALSHPGVTVTTDLHLSFHHDDPAAGGWVGGGSETALPPGFSWANGTGCPGEAP